MNCYIAVDLGATSGRVMLGTLADDHSLRLDELCRFPNKIIRTGGHCYWDLYALYDHVLEGLRECARRGVEPRSIGIDTWGVDVALFDSHGRLLGNPPSYRDPMTEGEPERVFARVARDEVYARTGIQVMAINTLFKLSAMRRQGWAALDVADKILFIPDALGFMLTGRAVAEQTIASTSELLNPATGDFDAELLATVSVSRDRLGRLVRPGTPLGPLTPEVQALTGLGAVTVVSVAGHDTASAVAAVPAAEGADFAYLSSGTWSLMGLELPAPVINDASRSLNYTNEGGVDSTVRFLKNICGMWLLESCRREWAAQGRDTDYGSLLAETGKAEPFRSLIFPDAACFAMPDSMLRAIADYCRATGQPVPESQGEVARCIFDSLALRYGEVFEELRTLSGRDPGALHIIGGGSRNALLDQLAADTLGIPVVAGPVEATAIGNILLQARADGRVGDTLADMRRFVRRAVETTTYAPRPLPGLAQARVRFAQLSQHSTLNS